MGEYLVLAGTGKTGRRVAARLAAAGHGARAAARHPAAPGEGVRPVRFDWDDPATYDPALAGADGLYLVPPALRMDFAPLVGPLLERAVAAGIGRVVLLSARRVDQAPPENPLRAAELAVAASGLPWTVLRPTWFMQNLSEGTFADGVLRGRLAVPAGEGRTPFIDAEDIAACAVVALTRDGHAGRAYDLSGPDALTWGEAAAVLGGALGRRIAYEDADPARWEAALRGVLGDYAAVLGFLFAGVRAGWEAHLSDGVQALTGREPGSLHAFAAREIAPLAAVAA